MRPGIGAALVPSINFTSWTQGLACRVVLFRDWGWNDEDGNAIHGVRLAQVTKAEGVDLPEGRGWLAGFTVSEVRLTRKLPVSMSFHKTDPYLFIQTGLHPLPLPTFSISSPSNLPTLHSRQAREEPRQSTAQVLPQKRKRSMTDLEIPDSEGEDDEDYGWAEEDEGEVPAMPPQVRIRPLLSHLGPFLSLRMGHVWSSDIPQPRSLILISRIVAGQ